MPKTPRLSKTERYASVISALCKADNVPAALAEHRFHPSRRWRFDFAWPDAKVALEIQGGAFINGRHTRGGALRDEHEKLNAAAVAGWRVLFAMPDEIGRNWPAVAAAVKGPRL